MIKQSGKVSIYNLSRKDLLEWSKSAGISTFYAEKIWLNLYRNQITDFSKMLDIREDIVKLLKKTFFFNKIDLIEVQKSLDNTVKFLFQVDDDSHIETVLMEHKFGKSICVTTQIGCNIGCTFCASGLNPKKRDLEISEIIAQILAVEKYLKENGGEKITHVVIMGIGEPFDNYDNVIKFLEIINDDKGMAIGSRHITVSTSGLTPKILAFSKEKVRANLAISLHAPNNILRNKLMKINKTYPLESLFEAIYKYIEITNKRVSFEYIMIKDFNDSIEEARELLALLEPIKKFSYVNLIPYNPVLEIGFERSSDESIKAFFDFLIQHQIRCVMRREHGADIDAACGQLRSKYLS